MHSAVTSSEFQVPSSLFFVAVPGSKFQVLSFLFYVLSFAFGFQP